MILLQALKGIGGEFEINRVLGAAGVMSYVVSVPIFTAWHMARGGNFDVISFCAAYPTGLGLAIGAIAGAVAVKDRNVATARKTNVETDATQATNILAGVDAEQLRTDAAQGRADAMQEKANIAQEKADVVAEKTL